MAEQNHPPYIDLKPVMHVEGVVRLPGSKSISNRVLLLAGLSEGTTLVRDLLDSDDTAVMLKALKALGCGVVPAGAQALRITGLGGSCRSDGAGFVSTTVSVGIELTRGPAAPGRQAELAYFVAVLDGEQILDKQVFNLRAEFPPNNDRLRLTGDNVELRLPVTGTKAADAYRIQVGFQLTPPELEVNRQRGQR